MTTTLAPALDTHLLDALAWRYATKVFDPARPLDPGTWAQLEAALVASPSSYGLQPYRFLRIQDPALRAQLRPVSWGQSQITDAAELVVFLARTDLAEADIDAYLARIAEVRGVAVESLGAFRGMMVGNLVTGPAHATIGEWAARQAYLALGNLMTSAALLGVDTCAIEGLDPAAYDRILGLEGSGYRALCALALGHRGPDDAYATLPKVRFPKGVLIQAR
jgi:nitroreductase